MSEKGPPNRLPPLNTEQPAQPPINPAYPTVPQTETQPLTGSAPAPPSYDDSQRQQVYSGGFQAPAPQPQNFPGQPLPTPAPVPAQQVVYRVVHTSYGEASVSTKCPNCNQNIRTRVSSTAGLGAWLAGFGLCLIGCICGCCLIPCCLSSMKVFTHSCPNCNKVLGKYKGAASLA